jgi:hypothetical protein
MAKKKVAKHEHKISISKYLLEGSTMSKIMYRMFLDKYGHRLETPSRWEEIVHFELHRRV